MKPIKLTDHAREQCVERGASEIEVLDAVKSGNREPAKKGRILCRKNFQFDSMWCGKKYNIKQIAPVIIEEDSEIVVITVYSFYF